ncbi:hypothetical protein [Campylobacter fetus]|uniref:hypothetical protein n=1 Tax=Campylobacter fetus TaxID=196 RepID=UPI000FCC6FC6|nr:hypothetical protein [Campylobacter fetus]QQF52655.1 hypothetical protein HHI31_07415 [Campylobacter fetus subsp. venerealis]RUT49480.1 hypothetical protein BWK67_07975 [Campylobacter fetus]RUT49739.1 hypothetical protein BWK51_07955 [Campylobacter fetus]
MLSTVLESSAKLKKMVDEKINQMAMDKVKEELAIKGKTTQDLSDKDLEIMLAEERDKIWDSIKNKSLIAVLSLLGLNFFGF